MNIRRVTSTLDRYLFAASSGPRASLSRLLVTLLPAIPETVVFGGMLREFALGNSQRYDSDIDLVTLHRRSDIEFVLRDFDAVRNKFGGYRFSFDRWMFDIWSLEDTWAVREGLVEAKGLHSLLETTFFDVDSAAFHLSEKRLLVSEIHERAVSSKVMGINLRSNPNPRSMALRALRMSVMKDLAINRELAEFVVQSFAAEELNSFVSSCVSTLKVALEESDDCSFKVDMQMPLEWT